MHESETAERSRTVEPAQFYVIALIAAVSAGAFLYKLLMHQHLGHSAAMFLGIPTVLAILLSLTPRAQSVTGGILKGITFALLLTAPLLGEGWFCILMASPLFYLVGIVTGAIVDSFRRNRGATLSCVTLLLLPVCLEGTTPLLTFDRRQSVEVQRVIAAPAASIEERLAESPDFAKPLPAALRAGFPKPLASRGTGLSVGDTRTVRFAGAEGNPPGDLTMCVAEHDPGYVRFVAVSDDSKLSHWIRWTSSEISWKSLDEHHTVVHWKIDFERQLDPAWYFTPMERAAATQAAGYLIDANAAPSRSY